MLNKKQLVYNRRVFYNFHSIVIVHDNSVSDNKEVEFKISFLTKTKTS